MTLDGTVHNDVTRLIGHLPMGTKGSPIPLHDPHTPYKYMGIWVSLDLNWKQEFDQLNYTLRSKIQRILKCPASQRQKVQILDRTILPLLLYHMENVPFSESQSKSIQNLYYSAYKRALRLPLNTCNRLVPIPRKALGLGATHIISELRVKDYKQTLAALRDAGPIGRSTRFLYQEYKRRIGTSLLDYNTLSIQPKPGCSLPTLRSLELREGHHKNTFTQQQTPIEQGYTILARVLHTLHKNQDDKAQPIKIPQRECKAIHTLWAYGAYTPEDIVHDNRTISAEVLAAPFPHRPSQKLLNKLQKAIETVARLMPHYTHEPTDPNRDVLNSSWNHPSSQQRQERLELILTGSNKTHETRQHDTEYFSHDPNATPKNVTFSTRSHRPDKDVYFGNIQILRNKLAPHNPKILAYSTTDNPTKTLSILTNDGTWLADTYTSQLHILRTLTPPDIPTTSILQRLAQMNQHTKETPAPNTKHLTKALRACFQINTELFSSINDVTGELQTWHTTSHDDIKLGGKGDAYKSLWQGNTYAFPPITNNESIKALRWAINMAERLPNEQNICAMLLPFTKNSTYKRLYLTEKGCHRSSVHLLCTFSANSILSNRNPNYKIKTALALYLIAPPNTLQEALQITEPTRQLFERTISRMTADNTPPQFAWKYTSANEPTPPLSASRAFMRLNKPNTNAHEEVTIRSIDDLMTLEDGLPTETEEPDELDDLTLPNAEISPPFGFTHNTNDGNHDESSNNTDQCIIELTQDEELELFNNNRVHAIYTDGSYKEGLAGVGLYAQLRTGPHTSMHTFGGTQSIFRAELFGILKAIELALLHPNTKHVIFSCMHICPMAMDEATQLTT